MSKQLLFVVLAVLSAQLAWAQQIYPPSQPSAPPVGEQKEMEHSSDRSTQGVSDIDSLRSVPKYLLVFPK
jgi:hypothetical protein